MYGLDDEYEQPYDDEAEAEAAHDETPTTCYDCGKISPLGWFVPDDWSSVSVEGEQQFICPQCWATMNGYRLRSISNRRKS